jgi:Methyltransferase FkbM domain
VAGCIRPGRSFHRTPHLRALGFDPLVAEVERLNRANTLPKVSYVDAYVGVLEEHRRTPEGWMDDRVPGQSNLRTKISSSFRAVTLLGLADQREGFNSGSEIVLSQRRVALGTFLPEADRPAVDFIKIDTDGYDFEVLQGAEALFAAGGVLGVNVECQFHGPVDDRANVFCNIDRFLRQRGFSFYDMSIARYSRAVLPQPFELDLPAQSVRGQACWGDAIYFRDVSDPHYEAMQLCQTIGRKLGRNGPISGAELQHLCATLNHLMAQRDVSGYVAKHAETLPRGVLPLIQFHRKLAQREQNVLLGQVLEGLHRLLASRMASLAEA